ncbi:helix-turn-helix domain-containing protein [Paenibacillus macquariensis]|uniref:Helix-turn-helix n=1 Tax=Paenibacillus macquariensis TaxID=948756 RepID=A0ABY1JXJ6_9BACL|nr:helix-turn-helix transcriptional regulator [Paenibacillus macquariensis]MEC0089306.1 helix-turn-helix transcriptional regulator [Paenibacillus macquariensis]OAB33287.1 hypothetical protein PMSM_14845 [Paenibacillus macquariensis subsp. macquariensis]SIQ94146.1 Helix-turn-helix [Paenibacillus macquariensis]
MIKRIGEVRTDCGYTIQEVAAYVNVPEKTLIEYEINADEMPILTATKLLKLYKVSASSVRFNP